MKLWRWSYASDLPHYLQSFHYSSNLFFLSFFKQENINRNFIIICGNEDAETPSIFVGLERNGLDHWFTQEKQTWQQRMNCLQWFKWHFPWKFQVAKCIKQKQHILPDVNSSTIDKKWHYITKDRWWVVAISAQRAPSYVV
jgi:hypothetical protein